MKGIAGIVTACALALVLAGCASETSLTVTKQDTQQTTSVEPVVTPAAAPAGQSTTVTEEPGVEVEETTETRVIERTTVVE